MKTIAFVFRSHPHSTSQGREGLDALLAASAYCEGIQVFFIGEGVTQLLANQDPHVVHSRNYAAAYKLMDLYDIEDVFLCETSLQEQGLGEQNLVVDALPLSKSEIARKLHACDKILTF